MAKLSDLVSSLVSFRASYLQTMQDLEEKAAVLNADKKPTVDRDGRYHAPCDGYTWEDSIYRGGQYLPFEGPKNDLSASCKIKIVADLFSSIPSDIIKFFELSCGKSWNAGGVTVCYLYIKNLTVSQAVTISRMVSGGKRMMLETEVTPEMKHGSIFKFRFPAVLNSYTGMMSDGIFERAMEDYGLEYKDLKMNEKTNKWHAPKFKGQNVCYVYLPDYLD